MPKKPKTASFNGQRVTARGKRHLESRAPQVHEDTKSAILLRGTKTSEKASSGLKAIYFLKKPDALYLNRRREDARPFEDASSIERLAKQYDAPLFCVASHSKKRPDNLILGRCFDGQLLDMFEFGVLQDGMKLGLHKMLGTKPCLIFVGEWDSEDRYKRLRNFLMDYFRGPDVDRVNLAGLEHVLVLALNRSRAVTNDAHASAFVSVIPNRLRLKKSGSRIPNVELESSGEPLVLELRRDHAPSLELWKAALKQPKEVKPQKRKNVYNTAIGETVGRLHVGKQDLEAIQVRKVKALKKSPTADTGSAEST